jgi:hypothetical protein
MFPTDYEITTIDRMVMVFEMRAFIFELNVNPLPSFSCESSPYAVREPWFDFLDIHIQVFHDLAK